MGAGSVCSRCVPTRARLSLLLARATDRLVLVPTGNPPVTADELEPLMPQKPGQTITFWNKLRFLLLAISHIFQFLQIRPSVVNPKVISVRLPFYLFSYFAWNLRPESCDCSSSRSCGRRESTPRLVP